MTTYKYASFLKDNQEYRRSERFWIELFDELFMEHPEWKQWKKQLNITLNDGAVIRDGNPIFSAMSPEGNKCFRIVQLDPKKAEHDFLGWVKFDEDIQMTEVTIQCAISEVTIKAVKNVARKLIIEGVSLNEMQEIIEKYNVASMARAKGLD